MLWSASVSTRLWHPNDSARRPAVSAFRENWASTTILRRCGALARLGGPARALWFMDCARQPGAKRALRCANRALRPGRGGRAARPTAYCAIARSHCVLIVQGDALNRSRIATVICVPLTSDLKWAEAPGNVVLKAKTTGLPKDSVANTSQRCDRCAVLGSLLDLGEVVEQLARAAVTGWATSKRIERSSRTIAACWFGTIWCAYARAAGASSMVAEDAIRTFGLRGRAALACGWRPPLGRRRRSLHTSRNGAELLRRQPGSPAALQPACLTHRGNWLGRRIAGRARRTSDATRGAPRCFR